MVLSNLLRLIIQVHRHGTRGGHGAHRACTQHVRCGGRATPTTVGNDTPTPRGGSMQELRGMRDETDERETRSAEGDPCDDNSYCCSGSGKEGSCSRNHQKTKLYVLDCREKGVGGFKRHLALASQCPADVLDTAGRRWSIPTANNDLHVHVAAII